MHTLLAGLVVPLIVVITTPHAPTPPDTQCLIASGGAAESCWKSYTAKVGRCRNRADGACETALRAKGALLDRLVAATKSPTQSCTASSANKLTFSRGIDDLVLRTAQACRRWADDFLDLVYADDLPGLAAPALGCQRVVAAELLGLRDVAVQSLGRECYVRESTGHRCDRQRRDRRVNVAVESARSRISQSCGSTFDVLGLSPAQAGANLDARIDDLLNRALTRARHFALRVYPLLNLGPTEFFGPYPVGVRTLDLVDPSRLDDHGTGPRPVKTEVYYPSTTAAVTDVPRDIVRVSGIDIGVPSTYRDVPRAPGTFPMVLYSTGGGGSRLGNFLLRGHLASHGFVVISPDHHGNDLLDPTGDADTLVNRPRDLSFLIDQFLAFNSEAGNFFEGAIDGTRIGATGHSYGGYTVMALASGPFHLGALGDARVKAILPLDGSAFVFAAEFPAIFSTITVPTLLLGGTLSPVEGRLQQPAFDALVPGPVVMAYGNLIDAGHDTFSDGCEVPEALVGFVAECGPDYIPSRHARHIVNYLALNFFDATLNGNARALARLAPDKLATIEELVYQSK